MQIYETDDQLCLFVPDSLCGKTSPEPFHQESPRVRTSALYWRRSSELSAIAYQFLDLNPGHGNLLGESYWETLSPYAGASSTLNTGASPRDAAGSSLSRILEDSPPSGYYLSRKACLGILRRAYERGKELPPQLKAALLIQAGLTQEMPAEIAAGDAYYTQPDVSAAAFSVGAGASAGGIGYTEEGSPTLKGCEGGNMVPAVMCLNDQGGSIMECSENLSGTLRAQEHGHQPLVYENHGIDARYRKTDGISPTMSARWGTGGNNVPLVGKEEPVLCIMGNAIDRKPENGGNGIGYQPDLAYTLTATDKHAVYSRQRVDVFMDDNIATTESARQHKDATDLVLQGVGPRLIRRLTPLECERLQGFPDGWTDIQGASDSVRYKALGNSVAIPCVEYVMSGIVAAMTETE